MIEKQQAQKQRELVLISSLTKSEGDDDLLEEYAHMKAKEAHTQSLSPSPPP